MEKILIVHCHYKERGGEDSAVEAQLDLLSRRGESLGFKVAFEALSSSSIRGPFQTLQVACSLKKSARSKKWIEHILIKHRPNLIHVHNFFPLITPEIFSIAKSHSVATVMTAHNYRMFCANAQFFRNQQPCTLCLEGSTWNSVLHGCYRNSRIQSLPMMGLQNTARGEDAWWKKLDQLIVLTPFMYDLFKKGGIHSEKMAVLGNFVGNFVSNARAKLQEQANDVLEVKPTRLQLLYVGRVSEEKGLQHLLPQLEKVAKTFPIHLNIVGVGPLQSPLSRHFPDSSWLSWCGKKSQAEVIAHMSKSDYLVVPSLWYEGLPMVIVEALSVGLPVLAHRIGNLTGLVEEGVNGHLLNWENPSAWVKYFHDEFRPDWKSAKQRALLLRTGARSSFTEKYSEDLFLKQLSDVYRKVLS